jgi:hypothetical protein
MPTGKRAISAHIANAPTNAPTNPEAKPICIKNTGIAVSTRDCAELDRSVAQQTSRKPRVKSGALELNPLASSDMRCMRKPNYLCTSPPQKGGIADIKAVLLS